LAIIYNPGAVLNYLVDQEEVVQEEEFVLSHTPTKIPKLDTEIVKNVNNSSDSNEVTPLKDELTDYGSKTISDDESEKPMDIIDFEETERCQDVIVQTQNIDVDEIEEEIDSGQVLHRPNDGDWTSLLPNTTVTTIKHHDVIHIDDSQEDSKPVLKTYAKKRQRPLTSKILSPKVKLEDLNNRKEQYIVFNCSCHVMILDSLGLQRGGAIKALKEYLKLEAKHRKNVDIDVKAIKGIHAKSPLQPNHCDCGVYVLQYIETFFQDTEKYLDYILVLFLFI
jgi:hypothetical protein